MIDHIFLGLRPERLLFFERNLLTNPSALQCLVPVYLHVAELAKHRAGKAQSLKSFLGETSLYRYGQVETPRVPHNSRCRGSG